MTILETIAKESNADEISLPTEGGDDFGGMNALDEEENGGDSAGWADPAAADPAVEESLDDGGGLGRDRSEVVASSSSSSSAEEDANSIAPQVEVLIVTSDKPISAARIADALGVGIDQGGSKLVVGAVKVLNEIYEETGRTFRIERVAGGYRLMTLPVFAETVARQKESRISTRLSQAALETLAIVAYRQPIIRADIEIIRGVSCGEVLRGLLERHLVKITGRAEEVGRPMLYGTTKHFLTVFGLASLQDLPDSKDLQQP